MVPGYACPTCGGKANVKKRKDKFRVRQCVVCMTTFKTEVSDNTETFVEMLAESEGRSRSKQYAPLEFSKKIHLASHQEFLEVEPYSKFSEQMERDGSFTLLRDPKTGNVVVRKHGDLAENEVSLVLG